MKYRKKPVVIEAVQWSGDNELDVALFMDRTIKKNDKNSYHLDIQTLEGVMTASIGDYIIKGVNGEFYPCKPDIFEKTYEKVQCKWLHNEVCVNDRSDECADFPSEKCCAKCNHYEVKNE
ncbi:MAG: hypothetical protein ACK5MV_00080 [Aminipila sp.]